MGADQIHGRGLLVGGQLVLKRLLLGVLVLVIAAFVAAFLLTSTGGGKPHSTPTVTTNTT